MAAIGKDKKIVIYSAANAHGYFTCIVHRYLYNRNSYAVYVGDNATVARAGGIELFDDNILYKQISGEWGDMNYLSADEYENHLTQVFDGELKKHKIDLSKVDEFYIGSNWSDFPVYLNLKDVKYNVFQEAVGDIGIPPKEWSIQFPGQYAARLKTGMFDMLDNKRILKAYVHPKTVKNGHPKVVPFDIVKEMQKLPDEYKTIIANQFNVPQKLTSNYKRVLLLTQWFKKNKKIWTSTETINLYALLIDLFFSQTTSNLELIIKPHPVDPQKDIYTQYFDHCTLLSSKFPSEFMGLISELNIDTAITVSSTSINTAESISNKQITVKYFENFYNVMPQIFICARLIKLLGYSCFHHGIFSEVLLPLLSANKGYLPETSVWYRIDEKPLTEKGGFILYDYVWREGVSHTSLKKLAECPDDSFCFIITDNINNLIQTAEDSLYIDYLFKFKIKLSPYQNNSTYKTTQQSEIYVFCKNEATKTKILETDFISVFPYTAIILEKLNDIVPVDKTNLKLNYLLKSKTMSEDK